MIMALVPTLTLAATAKPFRGHAGVIQRNALRSWAALRPRPDVLLFGDEEGSAEICAELGLRHVPRVARSARGAPRLDDLLAQTQTLATTPLAAYVNADIVLLDDFFRAVEAVREFPCLLVGQRRDLDVRDPIDFADPGWAGRLRERALAEGRRAGKYGLDYFVFPRGLLREIPPLTIGRIAWDNWLAYHARASGIPVVDATDAVAAIHQNHDYGHLAGGMTEAFYGEEAQENFRLTGGLEVSGNLDYCTHRLTRDGIEKLRPPVVFFEDATRGTTYDRIRARAPRHLLGYGAGLRGRQFLTRARAAGVAPEAFLDYLPERIGRPLDGVPVLPAEAVRAYDPDDTLVVITAPPDRLPEAWTRLLSLGVPPGSILAAPADEIDRRLSPRPSPIHEALHD